MRILSKFTVIALIVLGLVCTPSLTFASDFRVLFEKTETEQQAQFLNALKNSGQATALVRNLGTAISLPRVLTIQFGTRTGAFYDPHSATIHIPYSFALELVGSEGAMLEEQAVASAIGVLTFTLYHEVSHALFDLLDLGPLSDEEEAADALAAVLAIEFGHAGSSLASAITVLYTRQAVVDGAGTFGGAEPNMSLGRYQRLMCWLAGSEPGHLPEIAAHAGIPAQRIERCPSEYQELRATLLAWLEPHLIR